MKFSSFQPVLYIFTGLFLFNYLIILFQTDTEKERIMITKIQKWYALVLSILMIVFFFPIGQGIYFPKTTVPPGFIFSAGVFLFSTTLGKMLFSTQCNEKNDETSIGIKLIDYIRSKLPSND